MGPPGKHKLRWMKGAIYYLDTFEIQTPNLDCEIDVGIDGLAATDQEVSTGPNCTLSTDHETVSINCHLYSSTCRQQNLGVFHLFQATGLKPDAMQVHIAGYRGLDWQMEEDLVDNYQTTIQQID